MAWHSGDTAERKDRAAACKRYLETAGICGCRLPSVWNICSTGSPHHTDGSETEVFVKCRKRFKIKEKWKVL